MFLIDGMTYTGLGYLYYPNWIIWVIFLLVIPLVSIMSIELSIIVSARVNDARTAQQLSTLALIPLFLIYLLSLFDIFPLNVNYLLTIAGIIALIDVGLYFISRGVFEREEILTKWK